jgi:translocation and assembly module TamB
MDDGPTKTPRAPRSLGRTLIGAVILAVTFGGALLGGALLHLNVKPTRRLAARLLSDVLTSTFNGRITIQKIDHIHAGGFDGADAIVDDPSGRRVLTAYGLRGRSSLVDLAQRLMAGSRNIEIDIPGARAERVEAIIVQDEEGIPTLARAFEPRPSADPAAPSGPGPKVRVWIPEVEVHKVNARGGIAGFEGLDVDLANVYGSVLAGTDRTSIRIRRFSVQAGSLAEKPAQGTSELRIELPSSTGKEVSVWAVFDGNVADVQVNLRGGLDGNELYFTGDALRARPEAVRAFFPWWPIRDDVKVHVQGRGEPSNLFVRGSAQVGTGTAEFAGQLTFEPGVRTELAVEARDVDLRSFAEGAPETAISASATLHLGVDGERGLEGSIVATTDPFRIASFDVPPASITTTIAGSRVVGKIEVHDRALPSEIDVDVHPGPKDGPVVVDFDWTARAPSMQRVPWLQPIGAGELAWRAKGSIVDGRLNASVNATTAHFTRSGVALAEGRITGTVRGRFDALVVDASLEGTDFQVGPLAFPEIRASVEGPLSRLQVVAAVSGKEVAKVGAQASVETSAAGTVVRNVELAAARGDVAVFGKVRSIAVIGDRIELQGISVDGAGEPITGSLSISPAKVKVRVAAGDVDLAKVGAILLPGAAVGGRLSFDVDAEVTSRSERGHVRMRLENGRLGEVSGVGAQGEAHVDAGRFSGGVDVVWGTLGTVTVTTNDATLAGSALYPSSWENARGKLQIDSAVDLAKLSEQYAALLGFLADAGGAARGKLVLTRLEEPAPDGPGARRAAVTTPDVDLLFWTDGLRVGKTSDGVDVQLALHVDGGEPKAQLTARLIDTEGIFAGLSASATDVRLADFWRDRDGALDRLWDLPLSAELVLPRRNLTVYPAALRLVGWRGEVEATGTLTGSIRSPTVGVTAHGQAVEHPSAGLGLPVDVDAQARYDGEKALARLRATRPEGVVFDASTQIDAQLEKVLAALSQKPDGDGEPASEHGDQNHRRRDDHRWWEATGRARLYRFPLASIPVLSENLVGGDASGMLTFRGLNRDPQIEAEIDATNLTLDAAVFPTAMAQLRLAKGRLVVSAKVDQTVGGASATAAGSVDWTSPLLPTLNRKEPLDLFVEARDLRAAALYPLFLREIFSHFDGRLTGTMHVRQGGEGGEAADFIDGAFDFKDGRLLVPEIGQEFRHARAHIAVTERGRVDITNVSAHGVTGRLTASGKMWVKGLAFEKAEGEVRIAQKEAIPLTLEGVSVGDAWGTLMLHAKMANEHTVKLDIDVPVFHADLPESSGRDVQGLSDNPEIKVGVRPDGQELVSVLLAPPEEKRAEDALAWQVAFYLGQDVVLRRGSMMQLTLGGQPVVTLTDKARVSGEIEFRSGSVEVFGKRFEIEHGTAHFEGDDPGNPNVAVTARLDAQDGTRIYADFVGPLRTGLLSLRSVPARSQSEVVALLLFGSSGDSMRGPAPAYQQQRRGGETAGAVLAGGAISTSVNRVLASVTPLDITTRVTSDTQSPTPEVAVRLSPRVSAQVSYRTRPPLVTEKQDRVLVTLDWRFRRNWSIATTVGDRGGSVLDLIWKYRY